MYRFSELVTSYKILAILEISINYLNVLIFSNKTKYLMNILLELQNCISKNFIFHYLRSLVC